MRHRSALLALSLLLLGACAAEQPREGPNAGTATSAAPDPTGAPPTSGRQPAATRKAPEGVAAPGDRKPAPDLRVTAFDGRTVTLGAFRGKPVVVNFFESW
jgi:hypothetical protein